MEKNTPQNNQINAPKPIAPVQPNSVKPIQGEKGSSSPQNYNVHKVPDNKNGAVDSKNSKNLLGADKPNSEHTDSDKNPMIGADHVDSVNHVTAAQWDAMINSAATQWNKLPKNELIATEGHAEQISELVQKKYTISKTEADKQVKEFFSKQ